MDFLSTTCQKVRIILSPFRFTELSFAAKKKKRKEQGAMVIGIAPAFADGASAPYKLVKSYPEDAKVLAYT